jgi:hypothetical protein
MPGAAAAPASRRAQGSGSCGVSERAHDGASRCGRQPTLQAGRDSQGHTASGPEWTFARQMDQAAQPAFSPGGGSFIDSVGVAYVSGYCQTARGTYFHPCYWTVQSGTRTVHELPGSGYGYASGLAVSGTEVCVAGLDKVDAPYYGTFYMAGSVWDYGASKYEALVWSVPTAGGILTTATLHLATDVTYCQTGYTMAIGGDGTTCVAGTLMAATLHGSNPVPCNRAGTARTDLSVTGGSNTGAFGVVFVP